MSDDAKYLVNFVFKGLFLLWLRDGKGISLMLPLARGPRPCSVDPREPLREHFVALELPQASDWNREDFGHRLIQNQTERAGLREYLAFSGTGNRISILNGSIGVPDDCPKSTNTRVDTGEVRAVDDDSDQSIYELGRFPDRLADHPACSLSTDFDYGCVRSERRSKKPLSDDDMQWVEIPSVVARAAQSAGVLSELVQGMKGLARPLNLDLRVSMTIPAGVPLEIDIQDRTNLLVQPPVEGGELKLTVRNQEFPAILADVESLGDLGLPTDMDRDQEYYSSLAASGFEGLLIAVSAAFGGGSPQGSGCGGLTGGP